MWAGEVPVAGPVSTEERAPVQAKGNSFFTAVTRVRGPNRPFKIGSPQVFPDVGVEVRMTSVMSVVGEG